MKRQCGECQLCCRLLPVHDLYAPAETALHKNAGEHCRYQKHHKGCMVYNTLKMPLCCKAWNCQWLNGNTPRDIGRPDRVHYVVDMMPDFITLKVDGVTSDVQVVQIWCDPKYPDAHRDPALRRWLEGLDKQGIVGMVRYNSSECLCIFGPNMSKDNQWHEVSPTAMNAARTHTVKEIIAALGKI